MLYASSVFELTHSGAQETSECRARIVDPPCGSMQHVGAEFPAYLSAPQDILLDLPRLCCSNSAEGCMAYIVALCEDCRLRFYCEALEVMLVVKYLIPA